MHVAILLYMFTVYVPITNCYMNYMPIHTTWFHAYLLSHGATLHFIAYSDFQYSSDIFSKPALLSSQLYSACVLVLFRSTLQMELACVVSPVESFEDINNLSSMNQDKENYPNTSNSLGEIV